MEEKLKDLGGNILELEIKQNTEDLDKIALAEYVTDLRKIKQDCLVPYFFEIYNDLSIRTEEGVKGISKTQLRQYIDLPGILGEGFFNYLDKDKDGFLSEKEFVSGFVRLYTQNFQEKEKFIFDLCDLNQDGKIQKDDLIVILSHISLTNSAIEDVSSPVKANLEGEFKRSGEAFIVFEDRLQSQKQINKLVNLCFDDKTSLDFVEYKNIIHNKYSDMFLCLLFTIFKNLPSYENEISFFKESATTITRRESLENQSLNRMKSLSGEERKIEFATPKILSKFTAVSSIIKTITPTKSEEVEEEEEVSQESLSNISRFWRRGTQESEGSECGSEKTPEHKGDKFLLSKAGKGDTPLIQSKMRENEFIRLPHYSQIIPFSLDDSESSTLNSPPISPLLFPKKKITYCLCGNISTQGNKCPNCLLQEKEVNLTGYLYILRMEQQNIHLNRIWAKLINKELYCYEKKLDPKPMCMWTLKGTFIELCKNEVMKNDLDAYPFIIHFSKNYGLKLFTLKSEQRDKWVTTMKGVLKYSSFSDFYKLRKSIGKGAYGKVILATHKKTGKEVAIKIIEKKKRKEKEIDLIREEIRILKLCQHPHIVRLLDIFENHNYIYIVLEFLGEDLCTYIERTRYKVSEEKAVGIISSLCSAIFYLHSYGIAHRDLKPQNIFINSDSAQPNVKIADFSLSKILGPHQTASERFGTITYAAPEILTCNKYSKNVDIWSIGVITYLILTGTLPFLGPDNNTIGEKIVHNEPDFSDKIWKGISNEAKNLVERMLEKDPDKRIPIEEIMDNEWFSPKKERAQSVSLPSHFHNTTFLPDDNLYFQKEELKE